MVVSDKDGKRFRQWRFAVVSLLLFSILGTIGLATDYWQNGNDLFNRNPKTTQFYGLLNTSPLDNYIEVMAIGHNSGESAFTINRALDYGADVIEIDVVQYNGRLIAAHDTPEGWRSRLSRTLSLDQAWQLASNASMIQLDLKQWTPEFQDKLFTFLASHPTEKTVMVTTRDANTLALLEERFPDVLRFLSIGDQFSLDYLVQEPQLNEMLDGVTVRYTLLSEQSVQQLLNLELMVIAWTVNDLVRVNSLVEMGVTGITTDNLAILELIRRLGRVGEVVGG